MRWTMCPRRIQSAVMVVLHLLLLLTPLLTGCTEESGGVDAERSLSSPDGLAPVATITFPGAAALLTSGRVTVRGTAQSQHAITGVAVNGVPATSTDGFATWEATLALPPGTSSLMVSTEDMLGHTDGAAAKATVTVVTFFGAPRRDRRRGDGPADCSRDATRHARRPRQWGDDGPRRCHYG